MKVKIIVAVSLILIGFAIIAYPWIHAVYYKSQQNKLILLWEDGVSSGVIHKPSPTPSAAPTHLPAVDEPLPEDDIDLDLPAEDGLLAENTNQAFDIKYVQNNMEGILIIAKIDLKSPILRGATSYHLNMAVCSVIGSPEMGELGNYCLSGHYSKIYGRHFNRLKELSAGDIVTVKNADSEFAYEVYDRFSVDPSETWVLSDTPDEYTLTLITCDYDMNPIGRFIVRCRLMT